MMYIIILHSRIDSRVPERAEIAWVRVVGRGEVTFLSVRRKEDGVTDYEEEYSSFYEVQVNNYVNKNVQCEDEFNLLLNVIMKY